MTEKNRFPSITVKKVWQMNDKDNSKRTIFVTVSFDPSTGKPNRCHISGRSGGDDSTSKEGDQLQRQFEAVTFTLSRLLKFEDSDPVELLGALTPHEMPYPLEAVAMGVVVEEMNHG